RLELARALAEHLDDLPTAIAHASVIGTNQPETSQAVEIAEARGLEGRWRSRLGDRAGASLAFARLREVASNLPPPTDLARADAIADLLCEAAELERTAHGDVISARRHLAAALRLRPGDVKLRRAYWELGGLVGATRAEDRLAPVDTQGGPGVATSVSAPPANETVDDETGAAARVDELTRRLQGNPRDEAVSDELASLLEALGRGHELLALMSARIEEAAAPELRTALVGRARAAISRVAARAEASGSGEDASFYIDAMSLLAK
ncbi:MAG: hypothetical protein M3O36_21245, partial [Myxococcota bacterium]|nr:hypothetical protein [Myxococcota bacterium]